MNQRRASGLYATGISQICRGALGAAAALALLVSMAGCENNGTPTATTAENTTQSEQGAPQPTGQNTATQSTATPPQRQTAPAQIQNPPTTSVAGDTGHTHGPAVADDQFAESMKTAPVVFEPASLDFGILRPGQSASGTVQIRNTGSEPLRIVASRSSCKCTAVDLANVVIEPGESAPLTASMEPDTSSGPKKAQVRIAFEGYGQISTVDILAEVALAVRADPAYLAATDTLNGTFTVSSLNGEPFTVLASNRAEPDFVDFDPATDSPRNSYTLRWDLTQYDPNNCDEWPGWWVVETDHVEAPTVDLRVRHYCTVPKKPGSRRWFTTSQRTLLGRLSPGETSEVNFNLLWAPSSTPRDLQDHIIVAASRSKDFDVELVNVDYTLEEPEVELKVTPREDLRGLLYGVIELHSMHGHIAEYVVIGKVEEGAAEQQAMDK